MCPRALLPVLLAALLVAPAARAEPTEAEKRTAAEAIFTQATALMAERDFARACPMLEDVVKLQPHGVGAKMTLGDCYIGQGKLASAHAMFGTAASLAAQANQPERASSAQDRAQSLEPRLSKLTIVVPAEIAAIPGLRVTRNGSPVLAATLGLSLATDGGRQVIRATAPGKAPFEEVIDLAAEGMSLRVDVALRDEAPGSSGPAVVPEPAAKAAPDVDDPGDEDGAPTLRIAGIAVGSTGIVVGAIGVGVAVSGIGRTNDGAAALKIAIEGGDEAGTEAAQAEHDGGKSQTTAGWVVAGIGGAALVTGVVLFVLSTGSSEPGDAAAWWVEPHGGPEGQGVRLGGVW